MTAEVLYAPLVERDIDEVALALHHEAVYAFIGGMPSRAEFELWLRRALAGPLASATGERWRNFSVRMAETGELIGRLEANIHDGLAEVAFLYTPKLWGQGYASSGLRWLQDQLRQHDSVTSFWGTTHPENHRSAALMRGCGYTAAEPLGLPRLYSYEEGDLVFCRRLAEPLAQAAISRPAR